MRFRRRRSGAFRAVAAGSAFAASEPEDPLPDGVQNGFGGVGDLEFLHEAGAVRVDGGPWPSRRTRRSAQSTAENDRKAARANLIAALGSTWRSRYNLGLSPIVELSQAQLARTPAAIENTNARYGYQIARAAPENRIGRTR